MANLLAEILTEEGPQLKDRHRVAFVAMTPDIVQALEKGATAKRIWQILRKNGRIECSYVTFTRYINGLQNLPKRPQNTEPAKPPQKPTQKPPPATAKQSNSTTKPPEAPKQADPPKSELKGFHYNPTSLTMDDLLSTDEG